jgi:hypothetical protein
MYKKGEEVRKSTKKDGEVQKSIPFAPSIRFPYSGAWPFFSVNVTEVYHVSFIISFYILIKDNVPDIYNEKSVLCAISSL